jgi:hypothetical protein
LSTPIYLVFEGHWLDSCACIFACKLYIPISVVNLQTDNEDIAKVIYD